MNKFEQIQKTKREFEEAVKTVSKDDFVNLLDPLFKKYPTAKAVLWRQYTPYFNDGDPCRFSVHDAYLRFDDTGEEEGDYEDGFESYFEDGAKQAAMKEFDQALAVDRDIMERVFGDPVTVTIDRAGGVEVDEYYQG
jgi:hypothetical protein